MVDLIKTYPELGAATDVADGDLLASYRSSGPLKKLPADEIMILFGLYELVQKRLGPGAKELDDEEVNAWVRRLEEAHRRD